MQPKKSTNIWPTFEIKFVIKNYHKSRNLVTLRRVEKRDPFSVDLFSENEQANIFAANLIQRLRCFLRAERPKAVWPDGYIIIAI